MSVPNATLNRHKLVRSRPLLLSNTVGVLTATSVLAGLLISANSPGLPVVPSLKETRFSVAILSGAKQAAQTAPENVVDVAEQVKPVETPPAAAPVVAAERETSLPDAVKTAQTTAPTKEVATAPTEVLPPAKVSMPGGKLMAEDAPVGDDTPDPFSIKPREVYIRILLDEKGEIVRAGVVRSGGDVMRDSLILRAMKSRKYDVKSVPLKFEENGKSRWQVDLVIPYGNNEFLP